MRDIKLNLETKINCEESFQEMFKNNFCKNASGNLYSKLLSNIKSEYENHLNSIKSERDNYKRQYESLVGINVENKLNQLQYERNILKNDNFRIEQQLNQIIKEKEWLKLENDNLNEKIELSMTNRKMNTELKNLNLNNWNQEELIKSLMNEQEEVCIITKENEYIKKE